MIYSILCIPELIEKNFSQYFDCLMENSKNISAPCLGDLLVPVLLGNELCGLATGVDHKRVSVESLEHDGILHAEVVSRERVGLPGESVVRRGEILHQS